MAADFAEAALSWKERERDTLRKSGPALFQVDYKREKTRGEKKRRTKSRGETGFVY